MEASNISGEIQFRSQTILEENSKIYLDFDRLNAMMDQDEDEKRLERVRLKRKENAELLKYIPCKDYRAKQTKVVVVEKRSLSDAMKEAEEKERQLKEIRSKNRNRRW